MSLQPLRLIPAGAQALHRDPLAVTSEYFAYASTMALHIFRLRDHSLQKMIAAHERAISSICWSPTDSNLLASCALDGHVAIWDLESEGKQFWTKVDVGLPVLMDWSLTGDKIALWLDNGDFKVWEFTEANKPLAKLFAQKDARVLRWHPHGSTRLLAGFADGSLATFNVQTGKKTQILPRAKTSQQAVTDAQWDPLSEDYLLAAFQDGTMTLFDATSQREVNVFEKQMQPIKSIAWAKSQPGNFFTATDRVGVLRLWNVSQRAPLLPIKVGSSGVTCVKAIPSEPHWFLLSFKNSSVGVCDVHTRTMRWVSAPGHSETIFDVVFHPEDPDVVATASYDGYVKLWRISTSESIREMFAGQDQLLYGLTFGPFASRVCAVSSTGCLYVWGCEHGEQLFRVQLVSGQAFRCEWNCAGRGDGAGEIAVGSADNSSGSGSPTGVASVVDAANGSIIHRIAHPQPVIGVAWHPSQHGVLATACQDGIARIYDLKQVVPGNAVPPPQVTLVGHEARVFNLAFHPICPGVLATGSDDKTIRVWNCDPAFAGQREQKRLIGHASYVRGLLWHSELPDILFSGSWDATIRVWNVAEQRCIHVAYDHHKDVYGLTIHPRRPFFLVSSSRDTSLRFWVFEDIVRPMLLQAIVCPASFAELIGSGPEEARSVLTTPAPNRQRRLFGQASRQLAETLQTLLRDKAPGLEVYQLIVSFFMFRTAIEDLWGLLAVIRGEPLAGTLSSKRSVFHEQELIMCQKSKAMELASQRGGLRVSGKTEDRLVKAAHIMLRIGDLRSYCRFMAQAGHYERAICIAPAVSQQFWSQLCDEYILSLRASTDLEEAAPFWIATGKSSRLVDACIERGELDNAFVVAKADSDGLLPSAQASDAGADAAAISSPSAAANARERLEDVAAVLAAKYADLGEPLQAAMCFLAVSASSRAVTALLRAHEAVLAYIVAELLRQPKDPVSLKLLAQCAEKEGRWDVVVELLRQHPEGSTIHLPLLASRVPEQACAQTWLRTPSQHQEKLRAAVAQGNGPAAVLAAVCAGEVPEAVELGVGALYILFSRPGGWSIQEARALLEPLECLDVQHLPVKDIASILACSAYVGLVQASNLGYHELMFPLAQTLRNIIMHQTLNFPVPLEDIALLEAVTISKANRKHGLSLLSNLLAQSSLPSHTRAGCEERMLEIQRSPEMDEFSAADGPGFAKLAGANLPPCHKRHTKISVLTNQEIRGPSFPLEDSNQCISLADALAWARVNAFSPLNTGCKIRPL